MGPPRLPGGTTPTIDPPKLAGYTLDPDHPANGGKAKGWTALGFEVDTPEGRQRSASVIEPLICESARSDEATYDRSDEERGTTFDNAQREITGPNGKAGRMLVSWEVGPHGTRLVTVWVQPFREGKGT